MISGPSFYRLAKQREHPMCMQRKIARRGNGFCMSDERKWNWVASSIYFHWVESSIYSGKKKKNEIMLLHDQRDSDSILDSLRDLRNRLVNYLNYFQMIICSLFSNERLKLILQTCNEKRIGFMQKPKSRVGLS